MLHPGSRTSTTRMHAPTPRRYIGQSAADGGAGLRLQDQGRHGVECGELSPKGLTAVQPPADAVFVIPRLCEGWPWCRALRVGIYVVGSTNSCDYADMWHEPGVEINKKGQEIGPNIPIVLFCLLELTGSYHRQYGAQARTKGQGKEEPAPRCRCDLGTNMEADGMGDGWLSRAGPGDFQSCRCAGFEAFFSPELPRAVTFLLTKESTRRTCNRLCAEAKGAR